MDLGAKKLYNLPKFYHGLFTVWGMFHKKRVASCESLSWLLKEPVVNGTHFNLEHITGPFVMQSFCVAGIVTLRQVVDLCGPNLIKLDRLV